MSSSSLKSTALARAIRRELLALDDVSRVAPCARFARLYIAGDPADKLYYLESGVVKIVKEGEDSRQIILSLVFPGEIFGEQGLLAGAKRSTTAEMMEAGIVHIIPRPVFVRCADERSELWSMLSEVLLTRQHSLLEKIEML